MKMGEGQEEAEEQAQAPFFCLFFSRRQTGQRCLDGNPFASGGEAVVLANEGDFIGLSAVLNGESSRPLYSWK